MVEKLDRTYQDVMLGMELSVNKLQGLCYGRAVAAGWHTDVTDGTRRTDAQNDTLFPTRIALIHSELSEALEGHRKDLADEHLPAFKSAEVELADALIRIFDLAGAMRYDLGAAFVAKLEYNAKRADHKPENRAKAGGKRY